MVEHRPGYNCGSVQCAGCYPPHGGTVTDTDDRWSVQDGGDDRASALLDRGVVAGVFYKPWGAPLVYRIARLLNAEEGP